jgi:hypothetical protein
MTAPASMDRLIRRVIELGDYVRRPRHRLADRSGYKEWFHFCICSPSLDAIINFSLGDTTCEGGGTAQTTCAVRCDGWHGDIDQFESADVSARPGRHRVRLGESFVHFEDGHYRLHVKLRNHDVELDIVMYPLAMPSQVNNIRLGAEPSLHWFLIPKLLAFGRVTLNGRRIEVDGAHAYHDHNWGYFGWGGDFSWVWGYGHGRHVASPWSFAFDRLSNRARTTDLERGLLLWKGQERRRLFRGRELRVVESGSLRPATLLRLPRGLALTRSATPMDVPARLSGRAEHGQDVIDFEFDGHNLCQLLVPNDYDLGTTVINEVSGNVRLEGLVGSERVALDGHAMFEFLGD